MEDSGTELLFSMKQRGHGCMSCAAAVYIRALVWLAGAVPRYVRRRLDAVRLLKCKLEISPIADILGVGNLDFRKA